VDLEEVQHNSQPPSLLVVDEFYKDPDAIREFALAQEYGSDLDYFKGLRSKERFLFPWQREEFSRLLGTPTTAWLEHGTNGVFQQTSQEDNLVWHHDGQDYAGAVYLNPDGGPEDGTSFWQHIADGVRRKPTHPYEVRRLEKYGPEAIKDAEASVYDPYNLEHPDSWQLVDQVAGIYNRLVLWDASLIHSATSYVNGPRLVHLFFFDV